MTGEIDSIADFRKKYPVKHFPPQATKPKMEPIQFHTVDGNNIRRLMMAVYDKFHESIINHNVNNNLIGD